MVNEYEITSHESFLHDSIDSLGYDWERMGDPARKPKHPFKVYFPQTTEEVVQAVNECATLGQQLKVRSKGHSSNGLVLADRGSVLSTEKFGRILDFDEQAMTVRVQPGAVLAQIDAYLAERGYGLPIIGDHNHITASGFTSVGGISPASHRYGMFVDNVEQLEYVNWRGELFSCSRTENSEDFNRVLAGTGQHGVIATITCRVIRVNKQKTILRNKRKITIRLNKFVEWSGRLIADPGETAMERGVWLDYPLPGLGLKIGQFSSYVETPQNPIKSLWNRLAYGYLHQFGYWAGRLPRLIDIFVKYLGMVGIMFSPRYASIKNVETFTDRVLDSSVGDPTRMFIALAPVEKYSVLFYRLYELCRRYREQQRCFTFVSVYVKAINSAYLAHGDANKRYCELMVYTGVRPDRMTEEILDQFVSEFDDACIEHGAFRYMHSRTSNDPERRSRIDPNAQYAA